MHMAQTIDEQCGIGLTSDAQTELTDESSSESVVRHDRWLT